MRDSILQYLLVLLLSSLIVSCGGSNGGDGDENSGWITIDSSVVTVDTTGTAIAKLSGEAFVSSDFVAHQCAGIACIIDSYDDSYPGVDVTWVNHATGAEGVATSRYGTATSWDHLWSASVPVIAGDNELQVTAADPAGNFGTASVSVEYIPPAPHDLSADTGDAQITLGWSAVPEATAYRLYWATTPGFAYPYGIAVDVVVPPFVHTKLSNGTTYYYAVTSLYQNRESAPSEEIHATAGAPSRPANLNASLIGPDIKLSWDTVSTASTYQLYWANEAGVTKLYGIQIPSVISPFVHTGLSGLPYYYVVTAVNGYGESLESEEVMAFPPIAPPAPDGLEVSQRVWFTYEPVVDVEWQGVPGVESYDVYRGHAWSISTPDGCEPSPDNCYAPWERIATDITDTTFGDWTVETVAYWYYVTADNAYGTSQPSDWAGLCVKPPWF